MAGVDDQGYRWGRDHPRGGGVRQSRLLLRDRRAAAEHRVCMYLPMSMSAACWHWFLLTPAPAQQRVVHRDLDADERPQLLHQAHQQGGPDDAQAHLQERADPARVPGVHRRGARARVHAQHAPDPGVAERGKAHAAQGHHVGPAGYAFAPESLACLAHARVFCLHTQHARARMCRSHQLRDERRGVFVREPVLPAARPQAHVRDDGADHVPAQPRRAGVRRPVRGRRALGTRLRAACVCRECLHGSDGLCSCTIYAGLCDRVHALRERHLPGPYA